MGPPRTTIDMAGHARAAISATAHRRREYLRLMPFGKQFACLKSIFLQTVLSCSAKLLRMIAMPAV
jgi:hypothetical protein